MLSGSRPITDRLTAGLLPVLAALSVSLPIECRLASGIERSQNIEKTHSLVIRFFEALLRFLRHSLYYRFSPFRSSFSLLIF
jgi:hypothetical protein